MGRYRVSNTKHVCSSVTLLSSGGSTLGPKTNYFSVEQAVLECAGMSVGVGRIVDGRETLVAAAPRKMQNFGQVLLYVQTSDALQLQFAFSGEQIASGFGYDLTVSDFNGDG